MSEKITRAIQHLRRAAPAFIEPMQLRLVQALPEGAEWAYEIKFDGFRCLAIKDGHQVSLISRHAKSLTPQFRDLAGSIAKLKVSQAVIDGEIVALNENGRPAFQLLQNHRSSDCSVVFYGFDLLNLNGRDTTRLPLEQRRNLLASVLVNGPECVLYSADLHGAPDLLIREATRLQLEGIVAKRRTSLYVPGKRNGSWLKYKIQQEQEFIIGGSTKGLHPFESLLVGRYVDGQFIYCGKVRAGFVPRTRALLFEQIQRHVVKQCPFANLPHKSSGRWGDGLSIEQMKECAWVKPQVRYRIAFTEWTDSGLLRHPSHRGPF